MKNENFKVTDSAGTMPRVSEGRRSDDATTAKRRQNALPFASCSGQHRSRALAPGSQPTGLFAGARPQLFIFHFSFFILTSTPHLSPYRSSSRFLKSFNSFS
jgi:hypothetical protein